MMAFMQGDIKMEKMSVKTWSIGLQHVLAMYAGAVLVPLIVGGALKLTPEQLTYLISIDLLTCGVATLLQVWKNKFLELVFLLCLAVHSLQLVQ